MTPAEKIAAWDALSKLADAQQPSAEEAVTKATCEVCGRPQEWRQNDDEWCDRHEWNDILSKEECYRLGYERERARADAAERERDDARARYEGWDYFGCPDGR